MNYRDHFRAPLRHFEETLRGLRAARASPALVEDIEIDAYGTTMRLRELAHISTPDPRTIHVEPWDTQLLKPIEKALAAAPLGVNPATAGTVIRVPLPPLTEERRRELARVVGTHAEEARVAIRVIRERLLKDLRAQKEKGELSEDEFERERKGLQADVDDAIVEAGKRTKQKELELLNV